MTYCLGIKLKEGLVAISDTRLTSGSETTTGKKMFVHQKGNHVMFIMTSGLRSVRDKALTYFKEEIEENSEKHNKMYKAVNAFANQLRRVSSEDKEALSASGLRFNLTAIVGGQLEDDDEQKLFMLYPEGNWVEIGEGAPFVIIGNSGYGKPILDRTITPDTPMNIALKTGFLSFDSTRVSANDVEFPIDVILYKKDSYQFLEHRFQKEDVANVSENWGKALRENIKKLPEDWMNSALDKLEQIKPL
jgi:putative proteasome-type protease